MGYHFYKMVCGVRQVLVKMKREIKLMAYKAKIEQYFYFFFEYFIHVYNVF